MSDKPVLIQAHVCLECGAVWDRPTRCPFNGADAPTIPAEVLGNVVNREWARGVLTSESRAELIKDS